MQSAGEGQETLAESASGAPKPLSESFKVRVAAEVDADTYQLLKKKAAQRSR